jgi:hypothetical protein
MRTRRATPGRSALDRGEPAAAVGAVVQVLLHELLERASAEAEVLDRVREVARGRRERQDGPHNPELLAGLTVEIAHPGLDLANDLAVGAGAQSVLLAGWHGAEQ